MQMRCGYMKRLTTTSIHHQATNTTYFLLPTSEWMQTQKNKLVTSTATLFAQHTLSCKILFFFFLRNSKALFVVTHFCMHAACWLLLRLLACMHASTCNTNTAPSGFYYYFFILLHVEWLRAVLWPYVATLWIRISDFLLEFHFIGWSIGL